MVTDTTKFVSTCPELSSPPALLFSEPTKVGSAVGHKRVTPGETSISNDELAGGSGAPARGVCDVDAQVLAGALPGAPAAGPRAAACLRRLVHRGRGQHHLLRDPGAGDGGVVGAADRPGLPVRAQAAEGRHARTPAHRRRRGTPRLPGRDRSPRPTSPRPLDPASGLIRPRRRTRAGPIPARAAHRPPVRRGGPPPRVLRRPPGGADTRGDARHRSARSGSPSTPPRSSAPRRPATRNGRHGPRSRVRRCGPTR